jgi:hypothetical protein
MLGILGLIMAGAALIGGYYQARQFVHRRLRYVNAVQKTRAQMLAGVAATAVAAPLVWVLPIVGSGTALLFGAGVAAGVRAGAKDIHRRLYLSR